MGGTIGGLIVICLTILGFTLIRRKNGANVQATAPTNNDHHGRNDLANDAPLHAQRQGDFEKPHHWNGSRDPVELYSGRHGNTDFIELSSSEATPRRIK